MSLHGRIYRHIGAAARFGLEGNDAIDDCEDGVVLAETDVQARAEPATALADENRATGYEVAVVTLDAQPLRIAVAAVTG